MSDESTRPAESFVPAELREALKAKYPVLIFARTAAGVVALRPPDRKEWKRARMIGLDQADDVLCTDCVVHPARAEFEAMLNRFPAISFLLAQQVHSLALGGEKIENRKTLSLWERAKADLWVRAECLRELHRGGLNGDRTDEEERYALVGGMLEAAKIGRIG